jgi:anaerobic magnesium-protoporphyrin IX monomethyl ester cyclase
MKILLGQSYFRVLDPKELERQMPYPPLGALYAATILQNQGHEIVFYDGMTSKDPADFVTEIKSVTPDLLLLYDDEFNYLTKMCLSNMRYAAVQFIETASQLNIPSIVYSSDAVDYYKYYFEAGCNAIIYGEGEETLCEVVNAFEENNFEQTKKSINGLKFFEDNKLWITLPRKMIEDLDKFPDPDYSFVDIEAYRKIWMENHGYFSLNISTTRGCPYKCNWCSKPIYGKTYHSRKPENVAKHIYHLKEKYSIDHFWITDDIFGLKPNWIKEFANECRKLDLKIPYKCLSRPDLLLRDNTLLHLKESGCKTIWIGAESGSQKILDSMEKGTTTNQIYEAAKRTHLLGMEIAFFIQFGYLGEEWKDIKLTRKMIRKCLPEDIGISVSYPLPGTKFYEKVKEELKYKTNWKDSDDLDLMFHGNFERTFYRVLHRFVHAEFRISGIIKKGNWKKFPHLVYYILRYIKFWFKIEWYLLGRTIPYKNLPPQVSGI